MVDIPLGLELGLGLGLGEQEEGRGIWKGAESGGAKVRVFGVREQQARRKRKVPRRPSDLVILKLRCHDRR